MSQKPKRTLQEIQSEYQQSCLKAGHLQYSISVMSKDLSMLNEALRDLNFEAAAVHAEEAKNAESNKPNLAAVENAPQAEVVP